MRRNLPLIIVLLVAIATAATGSWLYQKHKPAPLKPVASTAPSGSASTSAAGSGHVRGGDNPIVTVEEYGDFQCPSCAGFANNLMKLESEYGDKMRVIFHQFPLAMHPNARPAAIASEAAAMQGKFWPMFDLLYLQQSSWAKVPDPQPLFTSFAGMLKLDVERFRRDCASEEVKKRVEADEAKGKAAGVNSTPTVFINGRQLPATDLNPDAFKRAVADAAQASSSQH